MHHPARAVAGLLLAIAPLLARAAPCPDPVPLDSFCVKVALPTQNVDGTPLDDASHWNVHWGSTTIAYPFISPKIPWSETEYLVQSGAGTWYVAATATDRQGNRSAFSKEVTKVASGQTVELPSRGTAQVTHRFIPAPRYSCNCPSYRVGVLQAGAQVYVDRQDVIADPGPYAGHEFLSTADADKVTTASPYITVGQPVLLAWDTDISYPPVGSWTDTGNTVSSDAATYRVYRGPGPVESVGFSFPWNDRNLFLIFE